MLPWQTRARWQAGAVRYAFALAAVLAACALQWWLAGQFGPLPRLPMLYPAVVLTLLVGGPGPAAFAALLAGLAALALPGNSAVPEWSLDVPELTASALFVVTTLALCGWLQRLRSAQEAAERTRLGAERERFDALVAEKEWLSQVLESIADEVYFTDVQQRYTYANAAALREFGHRSVEGLDVRKIIANLEVRRTDGSLRPIEEAPPLRALSGEVIRDEEQIVRTPRTGELRHRQVSAAPVRAADGRIIGSVSVVRDITERKRAEEALREADRRKNLFLATLSHELRNPLAPIRTAARLLETPGVSLQQVRRCQSIISRQVAHLAALLDDLLDVSRLTRGELTLKRSAVPLRELIDAAIETVQPLLTARRHTLNLQLSATVGAAIIEVDPVRFVQILTNLLTNAARYTPDAGHLSLTASLERDSLQVQVSDDGIGLPAEMLEPVFEMFVRAEAPPAGAESGLGIGLALVRTLAQLHGGEVRAHSAGPGQGSSFTLTLPQSLIVGTASDRAAEPAARAAESAARPSPSEPLRILLADDNVDAAESLGMLLRLMGHEVSIAHDGPQALALAGRCPPDVALLDIGMPGMSGYELARALRHLPGGDKLLLVAVTGWGQEQDKVSAQVAGFDHHLTKPADLRQIERLLGTSVPARRAAG